MIKDILGQVVAGRHLERQEAFEAMRAIMSGDAPEAQIGALLTALKLKGETGEEITGFAEAMRSLAVKVECPGKSVVDTCGTGGDGKGTFNVSTAVAFVVAGAGATVAKHGNHGISSRCGSADVLKELGIRVDLPPAATAEAIARLDIGFLYAPLYHPAMRYAAKTRRELGFRTVFNLLGPLTNPAGADRQLIGVFAPELTDKLAEVLVCLGSRRAMIVHSCDGLDEISTAAPTRVAEIADGQVKSYMIDPADYGLAGTADNFQGGTPAENAAALVELLQGRRGPGRDIVLLNAAAALVVAERAGDIAEGLRVAAVSVDSGAALSKLAALREFSLCYGEESPLS